MAKFDKNHLDILSAFKHIHVLDDLIASKKLENPAEHLAGEHDYYSLLIKSTIYRRADENDTEEIKKLVQRIQSTQNENGSWENTVLATTPHLEKLHNLGASLQDNSVQKALSFLFKHYI